MLTCTWSDLNHIESVEPHVNNFSSIICALNMCVYCKEQREMANNSLLKKIEKKRICEGILIPHTIANIEKQWDYFK